jgi:hypothetical protein
LDDKKTRCKQSVFGAICLAAMMGMPASLHAAPPDLTAAGAIAALKADANASPAYGETYNLGPTGQRGWIYLSGGWGDTHGEDGTMTGESRQILVTVASESANAVLAVDDVILGANAGSGWDANHFRTSGRPAITTQASASVFITKRAIRFTSIPKSPKVFVAKPAQ